MKLIAIIIFIVMYLLIILLPARRVQIALSAAILMILTGILPVKAVPGAIDWNVLMMMAGAMVVVHFFIDSRMPGRIADMILDRAENVMWVTIMMSLFAGLISAFIDNVATVLMVAPVALAVCKKLKISPVPMVLAIAVSSNLQGSATLVGDTTSIMLGAYAGMDFMEFFWMKGRPGIFFAVELGALATIPLMMFLFRKDKEKVFAEEITEVEDYFPGFLLVGMVAALIGVSFLPQKPSVTNGLLCMAAAALSIVHDLLRCHDRSRVREALKSIDTDTLFLLAGLFVVIQGITAAGVIDDAAAMIAGIGKNNLFLLYTVIVWGSVFASAFIDNIPYVATLLPVLRSIAALMGTDPYLLYFGLLSGATLGGNLTPIGASANIAAVGMLRKKGYAVSFREYAGIGIPFTLAAVICGYLFVWFIWS